MICFFVALMFYLLVRINIHFLVSNRSENTKETEQKHAKSMPEWVDCHFMLTFSRSLLLGLPL
jgi:hypothetical protein